MPRTPLLVAAVLLACLLALIAGCGSDPANPPPAEPLASPEPTEEPAGRVIELGNEAEGLAVDPETGIAAVALRDPNRIDLVDLGTGRILERVQMPESSRHLALARPGGPILAPVEYTDQLIRLELPSGRISSVTVGDFPHDAVEVPDGRVFVGDEGADTVSVVDGEAVQVALPAPEQPGGTAYSDGVVAVVAVAERVIAFYDVETLEMIGEVEAGAGPSHVVADSEGRFYVADTGGDAILVYEASPEPRLIDRANVPDSPYGIALDEGRDRLWVTQTGRNLAVELETTELAPKIVGTFPTVQQPNTIGVDESTGEVVVGSRTEGELQIFDPATEAGR